MLELYFYREQESNIVITTTTIIAYLSFTLIPSVPVFQVKKNPAFNPKFLTLIPNSHSRASIFEHHLIFDFPIFQFSSFIFQGRDLDDPYSVPQITSMFNFQNTSKHKTSAFLLPPPTSPLATPCWNCGFSFSFLLHIQCPCCSLLHSLISSLFLHSHSYLPTFLHPSRDPLIPFILPPDSHSESRTP